jgi:hypothetical protein
MVILVDLEARDVYIKHSKIVQFFNIRVWKKNKQKRQKTREKNYLQ